MVARSSASKHVAGRGPELAGLQLMMVLIVPRTTRMNTGQATVRPGVMQRCKLCKSTTDVILPEHLLPIAI